MEGGEREAEREKKRRDDGERERERDCQSERRVSHAVSVCEREGERDRGSVLRHSLRPKPIGTRGGERRRRRERDRSDIT